MDASTHTSRFRKFLFNLGAGGSSMKHILKIFSKPASNLTHLELVAHLANDATTSFPDLFGLEFPQLRVLEIMGIDAWPEVVGANPTHVTINASLNPSRLGYCGSSTSWILPNRTSTHGR